MTSEQQAQQAHRPVLLDECIEALNIHPEGTYVDGTFGRGGHSRAILAQLGENGRLYAFDKDPQAIAEADALKDDPRFQIIHDGFTNMQQRLEAHELVGKVDGILLDLGVSSPQLDTAERGFSFLKDGPLDMRMNPQAGRSAAQWIASADEQEMVGVFKDFGEERFAKRIARAIIAERGNKPITGTLQLAEIIKAAHPRWEKNKHPATRCFQAIRIFINSELEELAQVLEQTDALLAPGGRLAVISFHSLEDRMVKRFLREKSKGKPLPAGLPVMDEMLDRRFKLIGKAIRAGDEEVKTNPRARSAVLRVAEKL